MKFYFCESCGKRITEVDIDAGKGKDKKLKGVFCTACSVGVSTMDAMPLTDEDAKQLLAKTTSKPKVVPGRARTKSGSAPTRIGTRRSSHQKLPLPKPSSASGGDRSVSSRTTKSKLSPMALGGVVLGVLVFGGLMVSLFSGSSKEVAKNPRKKNSKKEKSVSEAVRTPVVSPASFQRDETKEKRNDQITKAPQEPVKHLDDVEQKAQEAFDRVLRFEGLAEEDVKGRMQRLEAFQLTYGATLAGALARIKRDELNALDKQNPVKGPSGKPALERVENLKEIQKDEKTEQDKEASIKEKMEASQLAFDQHFASVLTRIDQEDFDGAKRLGTALPAEGVLTEFKEPLHALANVLLILETQYSERLERRKKLVGRTVDLMTLKNEKRKGIVRSIDNGQLTIETQFKINGKVKGVVTTKTAFADFTSKSLARLFPQKPPQNEMEHMARSLVHLAAGRPAEAEASLDKFPKHALYPVAKRALVSARKLAFEKRATSSWGKIVEQTEGTGKLTEKRAQHLLRELDAFESSFGHAEFAKESKSERALLKKKLEGVGFVFQRKLQKLFFGELKLIDRSSFKVKLAYDFKDIRQLRDWGSPKGGARYPENRFILNMGRRLWVLKHEAFLTNGLEVDLLYEQYNKVFAQSDKDRLQPWFGFGIPTGKQKIMARFSPTLKWCSLQMIEYPSRLKASVANVDQGLVPKGRLVMRCSTTGFSATLNDGTLLEAAFSKEKPATSGFAVGGPGYRQIAIDRITLTGHLDRVWIKKALKRNAALSSTDSESISQTEFETVGNYIFEGTEIDSAWQVNGNVTPKQREGALRIDLKIPDEKGASLITAKTFSPDYTYRLSLLCGYKSKSTKQWLTIRTVKPGDIKFYKQGQPANVRGFGVVISNEKVNVAHFNVEKHYSVKSIFEGGAKDLPFKEKHNIIFEVGPIMSKIVVDGREIYKGPHQVMGLGSVRFLVGGKAARGSKGAEVWFRSIKIERKHAPLSKVGISKE